jgi:nicotinamidase-related amidase
MDENTERIIKNGKMALIVWDVQEILVSKIFNKEEFINNLRKLIRKAREVNIPIFYTKITPLPEKFESPVRKLSGFGKFNPGDIVKEVYPEEGDIVLNKNTASIFTGTNFEIMTRNAGINILAFTGIATEIGVETSARHAQTLSYFPIIIEDAVSSGDKDAHERSLKNMAKLMPVIKYEELLRIM